MNNFGVFLTLFLSKGIINLSGIQAWINENIMCIYTDPGHGLYEIFSTIVVFAWLIVLAVTFLNLMEHKLVTQ